MVWLTEHMNAADAYLSEYPILAVRVYHSAGSNRLFRLAILVGRSPEEAIIAAGASHAT